MAAAIAKGDMDMVGNEKGKIENAQREARQKEKAEGRTWQRRYFSACRDGEDRALTELGPRIGLSSDADKTGGLRQQASCWARDGTVVARWLNRVRASEAEEGRSLRARELSSRP